MATYHEPMGNARISPHLGLVWALFGLVALAIVVTYSRLPPAELYHTSEEGLRGGLSRALVFTNFPTAFVAIAMIGVSLIALLPVTSDPRRRAVMGATAALGGLLCLVTALPGVVEQSDLDAKPVNILPALGVVIALLFSAAAAQRGLLPGPLVWTRGDWSAAVAVLTLLLISLPWVVSDLGFYIDEMPLIGPLFMASEVPAGEELAAVHLGHHHGLDGFLLVTSALALGRLLRGVRYGILPGVTRVYLGLMTAYGLANLANDLWLEQVVKRGWVEWAIPSFLRPELSVAWALLVLGAVAAWYLLYRPDDAANADPALAPA